MVPIHERLGPNHDARNTPDAHRRGQGDKGEEAGYGIHPCRGGRYDNSEDLSLSPDPSRPWAFSRHILNMAFLPRY
jgi:hypothetical protein